MGESVSVSKIIHHFEALGRIPVPMESVVAEFRKYILDSGLRVKGVNLPANILRGTHYRYTHEPTPGSALGPAKMAMAVYSLQQSEAWQRLVCCKELIHILDSSAVTTRTPEDVTRLAEKLADKSQKFGGADDLQWLFDEMAQYQALAILFPFSLREEVMDVYKAGKLSAAKLAAAVQLEEEHVILVMSDRWKLLRETLLTAM